MRCIIQPYFYIVCFRFSNYRSACAWTHLYHLTFEFHKSIINLRVPKVNTFFHKYFTLPFFIFRDILKKKGGLKMKYITKKCPHCKFAYMLMEPSGGQDYGSPIQTCQKCGRQFIDKDYREIAVSGIRKTDTKKVSPNAIYLLVSYLIFIIPCVIVGSYDTEYFIWAIIISFLILLF